MMKQSRDFTRAFSENWNCKLKSVRLLGAVVSLCMLIYAILRMHSAVLIHQALKTAAVLVIIVLGMYQLVDYYYMPVLLWDGGTLISAVLNVVIDMFLLFSPVEITVSVFTCMFGFLLMIFGVNKITFANELHFFGIFDYSWVIASGVVNILAVAVFLIIPFISIVMLNTAPAGYSAVGGITLLVEVVTMKNMETEDAREWMGTTAYKA